MDPQAKRFIAGEKLSDAIFRAKKLNRIGMQALISHLGENVKVKKTCTNYTFSYLQAIDEIQKNNLSASVSIKFSQIGLAINQGFCIDNLGKILKDASKKNVFVWVDMEEYRHMTKTLDIFRHFFKTYKNIGITLQANVKGIGEIMGSLAKQKARIRIVKDIYKDRPEAIFQSSFQVSLNFIKLMDFLFQKSDNFAIATHDLKLIKTAISQQHCYGRSFEFQFLMGVRPKLENDLLNSGYNVSEYVPYGIQCEEYYKRRIEEQELHRIE